MRRTWLRLNALDVMRDTMKSAKRFISHLGHNKAVHRIHVVDFEVARFPISVKNIDVAIVATITLVG